MKRGIIYILTGLVLVSAHPVIAEDEVNQSAETTPSNQANPAQSTDSINQYRELVAETEKSLGPFDAQLGEQLLGLGLVYYKEGMYSEAREVLDRSLHIKRVNEGIQSMSQVPILKTLIDVNKDSKNWDILNQNFHMLLWVHQRNLDPGDPTFLPIIETVGQWKLKAYTEGLLTENKSTTLYDAINMYQSHIDIMEKIHGENDPRLVSTLNGLAMMRYQLVQQVMNESLDDFQAMGSRTNFRTVCELVLLPDGSITRICRTVEVSNPNYYITQQINKDRSVERHMVGVKDSLNHVVNIYDSDPALPAYDHARALVNLGDWYFINKKRSTATRHYIRAYQILANSDSGSESIDELFGEPKRIPSLRNIVKNQVEDTEQIEEKPYVKLSFKVSINGKARRIKVIDESDPENFRARKNAKEIIKASIFRPRFEDGKPVETEEMELLFSGNILEKKLNSSYGVSVHRSAASFPESGYLR